MKLVGYIKELKKNSFTIPVYGDGINYFYHKTDKDFNITDFEQTDISTNFFKNIYLSKKFDLKSKAALVFVGNENYTIFNSAELIIEEIINYLNDTTEKHKFLNIKKEAFEISTILKNETQNKTNCINIKQYKHISVKHSYDTFFNNIIKPEDIYENSTVMRFSLFEHSKHHKTEYSSNTELSNSSSFITKKIIESIFDENQKNSKRKELFYIFFLDYLSKNTLMTNDLIADILSDNFFTLLSTKSNLLIHKKTIEHIIEENLRMSAEERRRKMQELNYKFNNPYNIKVEKEKPPLDLDFLSPIFISQGSFTIKTEEKDNVEENSNQTDNVI